jgi:hypothetical protein
MEHISLLTLRRISVRIASRADVMGGLEATSLELVEYMGVCAHHVSSFDISSCLLLPWLDGLHGDPPSSSPMAILVIGSGWSPSFPPGYWADHARFPASFQCFHAKSTRPLDLAVKF